MSRGSQINNKFNFLTTYPSYIDSASSGSGQHEKVDEFGKYDMGFRSETDSDYYKLQMDPQTGFHTIKIKSTNQTGTAEYTFSRKYSDFGVNTWNEVTAPLIIAQSFELLKQYMEIALNNTASTIPRVTRAFYDNYIHSMTPLPIGKKQIVVTGPSPGDAWKTQTVGPALSTLTSWKTWLFLNNDYGSNQEVRSNIEYPLHAGKIQITEADIIIARVGERVTSECVTGGLTPVNAIHVGTTAAALVRLNAYNTALSAVIAALSAGPAAFPKPAAILAAATAGAVAVAALSAAAATAGAVATATATAATATATLAGAVAALSAAAATAAAQATAAAIQAAVADLPMKYNSESLLSNLLIYSAAYSIRLPAYFIFYQVSLFKGVGDISQEMTALIKHGGIDQTPISGLQPPLKTNNSLKDSNSDIIHMFTNNVDSSSANLLYVPFDPRGHAPRFFIANDRPSGTRYILSLACGLEFAKGAAVAAAAAVAAGTAAGAAGEVEFNNINMKTFGGYTSREDNIMIAKVSTLFLKGLDGAFTTKFIDNTHSPTSNLHTYTPHPINDPTVGPIVRNSSPPFESFKYGGKHKRNLTKKKNKRNKNKRNLTKRKQHKQNNKKRNLTKRKQHNRNNKKRNLTKRKHLNT